MMYPLLFYPYPVTKESPAQWDRANRTGQKNPGTTDCSAMPGTIIEIFYSKNLEYFVTSPDFLSFRVNISPSTVTEYVF